MGNHVRMPMEIRMEIATCYLSDIAMDISLDNNEPP